MLDCRYCITFARLKNCIQYQASTLVSQVYFYWSLLDKYVKNIALPQRLKPTVKDLMKRAGGMPIATTMLQAFAWTRNSGTST